MTYGIVQIDGSGNLERVVGNNDSERLYFNETLEKFVPEIRPVMEGRCNFVPLLTQTLKLPYYSGRKTTVTVGTSPRGVAFDGTHIWVTNYTSANVSKIDINTNTVVATIST